MKAMLICLTDKKTVIKDKENQREITPVTTTITQHPIKVDTTSRFARPMNEDDFSFLSDFTCKEITEKELTDRKDFLDNWFANYSDTFAAHASPTIAEGCQSMLVEDQQLLSAEALCRKGFFNYETKVLEKRTNLKYDIEEIKKLILQENIPLYDIKIEPREDKNYLFEYTYAKDGVELSVKEKFAFFDRVEEIATINRIPTSLILLTLDEMRDKDSRVNALMHAAYTNLQQQIKAPRLLQHAFANLLTIKNHILAFNYKFSCELRFCPQSVYWADGNLVILKGKLPESVVNRQSIQKHEVFGLQSMENGGNLYNVDLHEDDVLILAPRFINGHSLEGLRSEKGYKNMFFYDELPAEYLDKLHVPEDLRTQG